VVVPGNCYERFDSSPEKKFRNVLPPEPNPACGRAAGRAGVVNQSDERWLIGAAQRGDLEAFEELLRRYEVPVYRLALRMLGSSADAEDAAQDAFISAWRSMDRFRGTSTFGTWLYRITTNRCLNLMPLGEPPPRSTNPCSAGRPMIRWSEPRRMSA
jgi:hypothetical protein